MWPGELCVQYMRLCCILDAYPPLAFGPSVWPLKPFEPQVYRYENNKGVPPEDEKKQTKKTRASPYQVYLKYTYAARVCAPPCVSRLGTPPPASWAVSGGRSALSGRCIDPKTPTTSPYQPSRQRLIHHSYSDAAHVRTCVPLPMLH